MNPITRFVKNLTAPVQTRVLWKGRCVACTRKLDKQSRREPMTVRSEMVFCECGRAFVYDKENKRYRRATRSEVRSLPGMRRQAATTELL